MLPHIDAAASGDASHVSLPRTHSRTPREPPGTTAAALAPICKELHSMSNYRVQNPATGEIVETFPEAPDAEIESTVAAAHSTYLTWTDTHIQDRAGIGRRAAARLHARKAELAETSSPELG